MRPQRNTASDRPRPGTRDLPAEAPILADGDDEVVAEPGVTRALHLLTVARAIERVADHATNIAEEVFYFYNAQNIRHESSIKGIPPATGL